MNSTKVADYSFKILEEILMLKKYNSKLEIVAVAESMVKIVEANKNYSQNIKDSYKEALRKLRTLSYDEMNEIIGILSSYDGD